MALPPQIAVPSAADCDPGLLAAGAITFLAVSMYTDAYAPKAARLAASCAAHAVCCALSHVPNDAFGAAAEEDARLQLQKGRGDGKLPNAFRHRLIASKPLFILHALRRAAPLPVGACAPPGRCLYPSSSSCTRCAAPRRAAAGGCLYLSL